MVATIVTENPQVVVSIERGGCIHQHKKWCMVASISGMGTTTDPLACFYGHIHECGCFSIAVCSELYLMYVDLLGLGVKGLIVRW